MMKNKAKIIILALSMALSMALSSTSYGNTDVSSIKKELKEVRAKLKSAKGPSKSRLMKRMAKLENKLTESSSADRKRSK